MKYLRIAILLVMALCLALLIVLAVNKKGGEKGGFIPPEFDENAVKGTPVFDFEEDSFVTAKMSDSLSVSFCGLSHVTDEGALLFFTADQNNAGNVLVRIFDEDGNEIGRSGLIRPGEYVRAVKIDGEHKTGEYKLKISSYEDGTYYSLGHAAANVIIVFE